MSEQQDSFQSELKDLIDKWDGAFGHTKEDIINALMDAIEELEPDVDA